jgi:GH25 family lysozyme M1 (1,4-beta-N-acetylmuramidase)
MEKNITGTVFRGFRFEGEEVTGISNPTTDKWYQDNNGSFYWGGGLVIESKTITPPPGNKFTLPVNLPVRHKVGIDLSHHNEQPDWQAIKDAGIAFCFIKISEGVGTRDKKAKEHSDNARANNLKVGYYHFCRPDTKNGGTVESDAMAEANEALSIINTLGKPDLPLVLDLEDQATWDTPLQPNAYLQWVQTFIGRLSQAGTPAIIYSRKGYLDQKLPSTHNLGSNDLWIANYSQRDCDRVLNPTGWQSWAIWQFTESGVIGNNQKLDINILKSENLLRLWPGTE